MFLSVYIFSPLLYILFYLIFSLSHIYIYINTHPLHIYSLPLSVYIHAHTSSYIYMERERKNVCVCVYMYTPYFVYYKEWFLVKWFFFSDWLNKKLSNWNHGNEKKLYIYIYIYIYICMYVCMYVCVSVEVSGWLMFTLTKQITSAKFIQILRNYFLI